MIIIYFLISIPVIILLIRILLIMCDKCWIETNANILEFLILKKSPTAFSGEGIDDSPTNYISTKYEYFVDGKKIISKRISFDLIERGYRPIEVEHDDFIKQLKNGNCKSYYFKYVNSISVLDKRRKNINSNIAFLFVYITIILYSYISIVYHK